MKFHLRYHDPDLGYVMLTTFDNVLIMSAQHVPDSVAIHGRFNDEEPEFGMHIYKAVTEYIGQTLDPKRETEGSNDDAART